MLINRAVPLFLFGLAMSYSAVAAQTIANTQPKPKTIQEVQQIVESHCGACHLPPPPALLPKKAWPKVVEAMADLAERRLGQKFISEEYVRDISAYYFGSSTDELARLPYVENTHNPLTFQLKNLANKTPMPLIADIKSADLDGDGKIDFVFSDSESNQVILLQQVAGKWQERVLAKAKRPAKINIVDHDGDGDLDILYAELGRLFPPADMTAGKFVLLRQTAKMQFKKIELIAGVPRALDVRAVDLDGDNDLDLALSMFGVDQVGHIAWLENEGNGKHAYHNLINMGGGLDIVPGDINGDGFTDLVTIISQEYEMVVAMINDGKGNFSKYNLYRIFNPMAGSTGLSMVDMDKDGDLDVLFTNGDAHDLSTTPKPYHGVQWLENKGELVFEYHELGRYYGAVRAEAADMDGDGDIDVVAASWNNYWDDPKRYTLIWFENDGKQNFKRHNIIQKPESIVGLNLVDLNGDKRLDIVAGMFKIDQLKASVELQAGESKQKAGKYDFKTPKMRVVILENIAKK